MYIDMVLYVFYFSLRWDVYRTLYWTLCMKVVWVAGMQQTF